MVGVSIEEWTWRSAAVVAAALTPDGAIVRANPALERLGGEPAGARSRTLIEPSQHAALERRLSAAGDGWRPGDVRVPQRGGRPATDRRLWIARAGDELLVIGEPLIDEQERLVEKVLELNDELVNTHRELVRQRRRTAELLERERGIAETLQRALLPERLPDVARGAPLAHFEPAAGHVGGDWYDAVSLDSGELALAIGDVAGKGIPAAALMGELRGGLRAGVLAGAEPHEALRVLDRLADRAGHMATAALVLLDPRTGRAAPRERRPPAAASSIAPGGAVRFLTDGASTPLLAYDGDRRLGQRPARPRRAPRPLHRRPRGAPRGADRREPRRAGRRSPPRATSTSSPAHLLAALQPPEDGLRDDIAILAVERARYPETRYPCGLAAGGCGEIGIHAGFRCLWALRPWRFESSQPHSRRPLLPWAPWSLPLSSRGLGRRPLTAETGVRIPVAVLREPACPAGFVVLGRVRPR